MSYTYDTFKTALANLMVTEEDNAEFLAILPSIITYAEQRIYRELDLLSTVITDATTQCTPGSRDFELPSDQGEFVVVNQVNAITPANTAPEDGTRIPLTPVALPVLDMIWPSSTGTGVPKKFAMRDQANIVFGPWPDDTYTIEVVGTFRPAPLSADNTSTFLTLSLPDLFLAASMVFASGFMRNFGSQADDPKMAQSWEAQTKTLMMSAQVEEARKKFQSFSWSSQSPAPLATPARQ